jgi:hypothetical protein
VARRTASMAISAHLNTKKEASEEVPLSSGGALPLWQLQITELTGHNLEARGREEVNRLLQAGWHLLHIYTLKYQEDGVWRERPMAILGRSRGSQEEGILKKSGAQFG